MPAEPSGASPLVSVGRAEELLSYCGTSRCSPRSGLSARLFVFPQSVCDIDVGSSVCGCAVPSASQVVCPRAYGVSGGQALCVGRRSVLGHAQVPVSAGQVNFVQGKERWTKRAVDST